MSKYSEAPQTIISLLNDAIRKFHSSLMETNIAVVMREKASKTHGKIVYAKVGKFPAKLKPLFVNEDYDLLIEIAEDTWFRLSEEQKEAVIDHELCHCQIGEDGKLTLVGHDLEEFKAIIERHGIWNSDIQSFALSAAQLKLPGLEQEGRVDTLAKGAVQ